MRYLLLVVLCGCGGVKYGLSTTRGVACNDLGEALCERAFDCNYITRSGMVDCRAAVEMGCCASNATCGDRVFNAQGAADCVNRLTTEECSAIGDSNMAKLPSYCRQMF